MGASAPRRRGRPQHFPEDPTPIDAHTVGTTQRVAWLLSVSRRLGRHPEFSERSDFVRALTDQGMRVDSSRISRWESGAQPIPNHVAAAYEEALGLTEGSLVSVAVGLRRSFEDTASARETSAPRSDSEVDLDELLELADAGKAHGAHWLRIAGELGSYDRIFLRRQEWANLCDRLISELGSAVGFGYVRRYEAAAALMRQPNVERHLIRAIGSFVTHPDAQVISPVLQLLEVATGPSVNDLVLRLLQDSRRDLSAAAASVAATKVARGRFAEADLPALEAHVVHNLRRGQSLDGRLDSFDLAVKLPEDSWARVREALGNRHAPDLVDQARAKGELIPAAHAIRLVNEIAQQVADSTPSHHPNEPDLMLRRLLREALLNAHKPRRNHAALLLAASPYAPAVSHHCHNLAGHSNELVAARALTVLMRVGHGPRRSRLLLSSLAEGRPNVRARALVNLGLSPESLTPTEAATLMRQFHQSPQKSERRATLFVLGMSGSRELTKLTKHESEWVNRSARWWLSQGPALHDSDIRTIPDPAPTSA